MNIVVNGIYTTGFCTLCQSYSYINTCIIYHDLICSNCIKNTNQCSHCENQKCTVTFSQIKNKEKNKRSRLFAIVEEEIEEIDEFDLSGLSIDDIDEPESEPSISVMEYMKVF